MDERAPARRHCATQCWYECTVGMQTPVRRRKKERNKEREREREREREKFVKYIQA
jgi:hypothetical protein